VRHPREEGHHYAEGYPVGSKDQGGEGLGHLAHIYGKNPKKSIKVNWGSFEPTKTGACVLSLR